MDLPLRGRSHGLCGILCREVTDPLLDVSRLTIGFDTQDGAVAVVHEVSFRIDRRETLALVGESGSGKSLTGWSILRVLPPASRIFGGSIRFDGRDLLALAEDEIRAIRGARIALIPQEPSAALTPVLSVGDQLAETLTAHGRGDRRSARREAIELLDAVRLPDPASRADDYPHQLSGGQLQRVLIAMALACQPSLIIADEPTTALDVRVQAEILDLLRDARERHGLSMLFITHDLGVVAAMADRIAVMHGGRIVEEGGAAEVFRSPAHAYTRTLLASGQQSGDVRRVSR